MAALTVTQITTGTGTGVTITTACGSGGDTVEWKPGKWRAVMFRNQDASGKTITITAQNPTKLVGTDEFTVPSIAYSLAAGAFCIIPVTEAYADASNVVSISYSDVTSLTVKYVEMAF